MELGTPLRGPLCVFGSELVQSDKFIPENVKFFLPLVFSLLQLCDLLIAFFFDPGTESSQLRDRIVFGGPQVHQYDKGLMRDVFGGKQCNLLIRESGIQERQGKRKGRKHMSLLSKQTRRHGGG